MTQASSCANQDTPWWALLTNGEPDDTANSYRGFQYLAGSVFNTCECPDNGFLQSDVGKSNPE